MARIVRSIRALELKKAPSVSETLDWARTLVVLGVETIDADMARKTLNVLLKYKTDLDRVAEGARPDGGDSGQTPERTAVLDVLKGFVTELRAAGLPVSLTESIDAAEAVGHIPLRGPRGAQVRARGDAREVLDSLARFRDGVRGVLLDAGIRSSRSTVEHDR